MQPLVVNSWLMETLIYFHIGDDNSQDSKKVSDVLHSLNLEQRNIVNEPTHSPGHILDLMITRCRELSISNL